MTRVKICGLSDMPTAIAAGECGADYIGFVFVSSRRQVASGKAAQIVEAVKKHFNPCPLFTGVFVNTPAHEVNRIADYCKLDRVQLSGNENWEYCREIGLPVIKVIHVTQESTVKDIAGEIELGYRTLKREFICLLDTYTKNKFGGTGQVFDWSIAKEIAGRFPVIVAGGLTPENVNGLVMTVKPYGVDVSGGVETDGKKDVNKIKEFIQAVRKGEP